MTPDSKIPPELLSQSPDMADLPRIAGGGDVDVEQLWTRFSARHLHEAGTGTHVESPKRRWISYRTAIAATIGAVAVVAIAIPSVRSWIAGNQNAQSSIRYTTGVGERRTVMLPDGSEAVLAPNSALTFNTTNDASIASLDGRAVFRVVQAAERAFVVKAGDVSTRVLGTVFDVQHYANDVDNDAEVMVSVASGKVAVQRGGTPVVLTEGMRIDFTDSVATIQRGLDPDASISWTRGQLAFDDVPVPVVLKTLERWYGYQLRVTDSALAADGVTTVLPVSNAEQAFQALKELLNVTLTIQDSVIVLSPQQTKPLAEPRTAAPSREVGK